MRPQASEEMSRCHACGGEVLREGTHTLRRTVGGRTFERTVPALVCGACNEAVFSSVDLAALERQIGREVLALGMQTPDAVAWVLDGYDLGPEVLGATWREVKAWGTGEAAMPDGVWPALLAAVQAQGEPHALAGE